MELMSPAGGAEAAYAALQHGADAVYVGLRRFSARADAENVGLDELDELTAYAHAQTPRRSVYLTLNTLVANAELAELAGILGAVSEIGVDALIIQDLGLCRMARHHFPRLALHASTQLAVHNREGVATLARLGFTRVTLAREMTLAEIREAAGVPGCEVQVFVHGALCYSYSGLCLMSSHLLGRSGNRGRCASPCRDTWRILSLPSPGPAGDGRGRETPGGFIFSMKDLALPDDLDALREAGVASLKIEGRKKSPLYVAAVTDFYRRLLDARLDPADRAALEADIRTIFSRPVTTLYLRSSRNQEVVDPRFIGHRGTLAGAVESIARRSGVDVLQFRSTQPVELHDGIQIEIPGIDKPYGFPVLSLRAAPPAGGSPRGVFAAPAGSLVLIDLPADHPRIPLRAPVYLASSQAVKRRYGYTRPRQGAFRNRTLVDVALTVADDAVAAAASFRAVHGPENLEARAALPGPFQPAREPTLTARAAETAFSRLGNTRLSLGRLTVSNPGGLFVPVSLLSDLRRALADAVEAALTAAREARVAAVARLTAAPAGAPQAGTAGARMGPLWSVKVHRLAFINAFEPADWSDLDEVVVDISRDPDDALAAGLGALADRVGRGRVRLALPLLTRSWEARPLRAKIERLRGEGWDRWEAANVDAWTFLGLDPAAGRPEGGRLAADWSVYVLNRMAALQVLDMGASRFVLSPEDGLANMASVLAEFPGEAVAIVYQDTPLFVSDSCVFATAAGSCPGPKRCDRRAMDIQSSFGDALTAVRDGCRTVVLMDRPFSLAARLDALRGAGARRFRADFLYRPFEPAQVRDIWRALRAGRGPEGHVGNFDRGLL